MSSPIPAEPSIGFLLKRAQHMFRTSVDEALRPFELTAPQFAVLSAVETTVGISNADLARLAFVTPQTMQGILAGLERSGLLERRPHPQHGRILCSNLTAKGLQVVGEARVLVEDIENRLAQAVGETSLAAFSQALARCADALSS